MANGGLRAGRSRGGAQISLAVCAALACVLIFLGRVQPTLFDRARSYASDRTAPVLEAVRTPFRAAGAWAGSLADVFRVYQVNLKLKDARVHLEIDPEAAERAKLRISSKLLSLAEITRK